MTFLLGAALAAPFGLAFGWWLSKQIKSDIVAFAVVVVVLAALWMWLQR